MVNNLEAFDELVNLTSHHPTTYNELKNAAETLERFARAVDLMDFEYEHHGLKSCSESVKSVIAIQARECAQKLRAIELKPTQ